jgi:formylglycine-generating enzyme required for sulfatase activity
VSPALVLPDAAAEIEVPTQIAEPPSGALLADDDATMRNSGPPPTLILSPGDGGRPGALRWPELPWRAWLERARTLFVTRPSAATLRKAALAALGVVGLVAAFAYGRERRDESLYAAAARAATAAAYRDYLARCALCAHRAEAEAALLALEGYATPTTSGASLAITPQPAPRGEPARTAAAPSQGRTAARAAPSTATSAPAPAPRIAPGTVFRDSLGEAGQGPPLVMLAGGSFTIGDPTRTIPSATPLRTVRIAPFALGEREVTRGEFRAFVDATGHETDAQQNGGCRVSRDGTQVRDRWSSWKRGPFSQSDQSPVICVSWRDAQAYVAWLAQRTGRRYRLPTEAEWEYAARAGSTGTYWWGEDGSSGRANCAGCGRGSRKRTVDADEFEPNPWGLRNTAGNVWEWTCSVFEPRYAGAEARCAASSSLGERAIRGGSWAQGAEFLRSAYRASAPPGLASDTVGFRVALDP